MPVASHGSLTATRMLAAPSDGGRSASLRRLAAAKARRERDPRALVQQQQQQQEEQAPSTVPAQAPQHAVTAVESKASDVQVCGTCACL